MKDIYLYDDCSVLKNKFGIRIQEELDAAEADYVVFRLKELHLNPLPGNYDYEHFLRMHNYIFQDIYEWAGKQRKINMYKEEPVLGGLSVEYSDIFDIEREARFVLGEMNQKPWKEMNQSNRAREFAACMAQLWKVHCFREGNTRTVVTFCCQFADEKGLSIKRELFEENANYLRTALVAYNAVFHDLGNLSKKEYLEKIVLDALNYNELV